MSPGATRQNDHFRSDGIGPNLLFLVPMGHDPDSPQALSIYILCCVGVLSLSFFYSVWLFWDGSALAGPLFLRRIFAVH